MKIMYWLSQYIIFPNVLADNFKLSNERIYDLNERCAHLKDQTSSDFPVDFIRLYSYPSPPTQPSSPHTTLLHST